MVIQTISSCKGVGTIFALIGQCPWEMNIFYMLSQITPITSKFPTDCTLVHFRTTLWIFDNILIENGHGRSAACNILRLKTEIKVCKRSFALNTFNPK